MAKFTPTLYIDIGETGAYFTLRETYLRTVHVPGAGPAGNAVINGAYQGSAYTELLSFHHCNLSQDPDEAFQKAQAYASEMGLALTSTREGIEADLRTIQRTTREEIERRERAAAEENARRRAEREAEHEAMREQIRQGVFPFGQYTGERFEEAPVGYLNWLMDKQDEFERDGNESMTELARAVTERCAHLRFPTPDPEATRGEPKQRLELDVTVIFVTSFIRDSFSAWGAPERVYVVKMVDAEGVCYVSMSASFHARVGDRLQIRGTVKKHDWYRDQAQTHLQRIKVLARHPATGEALSK